METVVIRKSSGRFRTRDWDRDCEPGLETDPGSPTPTSRQARELAGLDDRELLRIFGSLPPACERRAAACELLVSRHRGLVRSCVLRFRHSPEPADDLMQVGYVGLMKAINNFDPAIGDNLGAYAQRCITGEIKRHFRDKRWHAHVERPVQGLVLRLRMAYTELIQELGRIPTEADLAERLAVSKHDIRTARKAELALQPASLDAPVAGRPDASSLAELLGTEDPRVELMLDWQALASHWNDLTSRDQRILLMRFFGDLTQAEIGERLGISQMQVSRLIAAALARLRRRLLDADGSSGRVRAGR